MKPRNLFILTALMLVGVMAVAVHARSYIYEPRTWPNFVHNGCQAVPYQGGAYYGPDRVSFKILECKNKDTGAYAQVRVYVTRGASIIYDHWHDKGDTISVYCGEPDNVTIHYAYYETDPGYHYWGPALYIKCENTFSWP